MALFALAYSSHILWSWPSGRIWHQHTSYPLNLYLNRFSAQPNIFYFLRRWIMEPTLCVLVNCSPAWSCPQIFKSGLRMRLGEEKFGFWQGVVFLQSFFWNFKAIPNTEIILTSIQSRTHSDKIQVIPMERFSEMMETFLFLFWKIRSDIGLVTKGWNFNLRVIENRFQSIHFICMNNDLACMRKHCLPIQIARLWSERAWLGT